MAILGMKLATGEELIADVTNSGDNRFKLSNAVKINLIPSTVPNAPPSLGFVPFPEFAEEEGRVLVVEPLHVVYNYTPEANLVANYQKMVAGETSSATSQLIVG